MIRKVFLRRGEVLEWLTSEYGMREWYVRSLLKTGAIEARYLPGPGASGGKRRALYSRGQIERDVLAGLLGGVVGNAAGGSRKECR